MEPILTYLVFCLLILGKYQFTLNLQNHINFFRILIFFCLLIIFQLLIFRRARSDWFVRCLFSLIDNCFQNYYSINQKWTKKHIFRCQLHDLCVCVLHDLRNIRYSIIDYLSLGAQLHWNSDQCIQLLIIQTELHFDTNEKQTEINEGSNYVH